MIRAIEKAIDCVFQIKERQEKARQLNAAEQALGLPESGVDFTCVYSQEMLADFLDEFFYTYLPDWPPEDMQCGGLATYAIYDAAMPYIDGKPYDISKKDQFKLYVEHSMERNAE